MDALRADATMAASGNRIVRARDVASHLWDEAWSAASCSKQENTSPEMPSVSTALVRGALSGGIDLFHTGEAVASGTSIDAEPAPEDAPLHWSDLLDPGGKLAPKLAFQIARSWPTVAGGIAGTTIGVAIAAGPEDPISWFTGPAGGFIGAGIMNDLQTFGNYFGEELRRTPADADGAFNRAFERAAFSGLFAGAAWAAFPMRAFPIKTLMFQAFGVQPGVGVAHQVADNALTGRPLADGVCDAYTQGLIGTLPVAGGHYVGRTIGGFVAEQIGTRRPSEAPADLSFTPPLGFRPRVDLADRFNFRRDDGEVFLSYGNTDAHGITVYVKDNGVLDSLVRANGNPALGSGRDMFFGAMKRLDQEGVRVKAIKGLWFELDSDNALEYWHNISKGMSQKEAALNTWTGRRAVEYGFTRTVEVDDNCPPIIAIFSK